MLKGMPLAVILGNSELFTPPFENYFGMRTAMLWSEYIDTKGTAGVKPPEWVGIYGQRHSLLSRLQLLAQQNLML